MNADAVPGGLAALRAIRDRRRPQIPLGDLLGFTLVEAEPGRVAFDIEPAATLANSGGVIHGGVLGIVLDQAVGDAVRTTLPDGVGYATVDLFVSYLHPVHPDETVRCEAWVTHRARRTVRTAGRADQGGTPVAACMATLRVAAHPEEGAS